VDTSTVAGAPLFSGVGVALVTCFDDAGDLDAGASAELAGRLVELGVRGFLVAGTTGEASSLEPEERTALIRQVRRALPAEVPVLAGVGAPSARQAVRLMRAALDAGADALLALSPPQSSDPRPYYEALAKQTPDHPLLAYHFPVASAPGLPVGCLDGLPVAGLKDSSGDLHRLVQERLVFDGWLYTGSAHLVLSAGALGCAGAILAIANLDPETAIAAFQGDAGAQLRLSASSDRTSGPWPQALKEAVASRFGTSSACRMG